MPLQQEDLIKAYKENILVYQRLTQAVERILTNIVEQENIECAMPIQSRTKDILSFLEKVERKGYERPFLDMTDIGGCRVVLFSENDAKFMFDIIEDRFKIDRNRTINKKENLGRNQFGYSGINCVAFFKDDDQILVEQHEFKDKSFEIQLLTICQLLWAEMQRKIEYKIEDFVSAALSRRLSMLSALFELADIEFQYLHEKGTEELLTKPMTIRSLRLYIDRSRNVGKILSRGLKEGVFAKALPEEDLVLFNELHECCSSTRLRTLSDLDAILGKDDLINHLFKSVKKHACHVRAGPIMITLLLLYHFDEKITKDTLLAKKWDVASIDFIIDRT